MPGLSRRRFIQLAALIYFVSAMGWIFLSDRLLSVFTDVQSIVWLSTAKGVFFVLATTVLLILLLRRVPDSTAGQGAVTQRLFPSGPDTPGGTSPWILYGAALLLPVAALFMIQAASRGGHLMLILMMLPIILSALLGGLGPGLVATAVAVIGADFWLIAPLHNWRIADDLELLQWFFLLANGVAVSVLSEQLRRSQERAELHRQQLEAIVSGTSDAIFVKDTQGRYLMMNDAGARFVGRPVQDIIGRDDSELFPTQSAQALRHIDLDVMNGGATRNHIENIQMADGQQLSFSVTKGPVFDAFGHLQGLFGISRDITDRVRVEAKLIESEDLYRTAFSASPDAISITRPPQHTYLQVNESFVRMFGWSAQEVTGRTPADLALWVDRSSREYQQLHDLPAEGCDNLSTELRSKDGRVLHVQISAHPIRIQGELCTLTVTRDVSARKQADEALHIAALVYQSTSEGMMVTNEKHQIIAVNPAFEVITGYSAQDVIGQNPRMLSSQRNEAAFYRDMWQQLEQSGYWEGDIWNRHKNGTLFLEHMTINTIRNEDGSVHRRVALFADITHKKEAEDFIWRQANFDLLTQLPNRQMFHDRLQQEIKRAHRSHEEFALLFIDLDNFKEVNDTLGHHVGDVLLTQAAQRISGCIREMDTCARMGGDEFTVLLSGTSRDTDVQRVAADILEKLKSPFMLNGDAMVISASIGVTVYPGDALEADALLKNADQAMYVAKKSGKNQYSYFTADLQAKAIHRLRLISDLRNAVAQKELRLLFQPIVNLSTGGIDKAEALVRWMHPQRGLVSPVEFIPAAEESGLIVPIGDWVFQEAARWTQQWRKAFHPHFQVSVNKSPVQFQRGAAGTDWVLALQELGLPGEAIAVEITEGVLMNSDPGVNSKLLEYRNGGLKISIDDFGTGYSSLAYLKKFDIDFLKIDQSFTRNLAPGSSDLALSEAIIVMAHKLGLKVIAEGVETQEQRDLLLAIGCDYGQGYLFSRPVTPQEFEKLLA